MKKNKTEILCELIAIEVGGGATVKSVKKYLSALYRVILKQFKINQKVQIPKFGTFKLEKREERDMVVGDPVNGGTKTIHVKPKYKVEFIASGFLDDSINKNRFKLKPRQKKPKNKLPNIETTLEQMLKSAFERSEN